MFYKAIKQGLIDPRSSVQIGIRTWNEDFLDMNVLGTDWVHANGTGAASAKALDIVLPVHITGRHPGSIPSSIMRLSLNALGSELFGENFSKCYVG